MFKKFLQFIVLCLITLVAGEIALRYIPSNIQYPLRIQFSNTDGIGVVHPSNISVTNRSQCFNSVSYSTNKWGMHDKDRTLEKKEGVYRVAMIGDSMLDAEQVNNEEVINRLLDEKFAGKAEFLNFGMNAIGTMQANLLYEKKVRNFNPDMVLLMFYTENDIANNSVSLEAFIFNGEPFLTYRNEDGSPHSVINFNFKKEVKQFLNKNFALFRLVREVQTKIKFKANTPQTDDVNNEDKKLSNQSEAIDLASLRQGRGANIRTEVFIVPPDDEWEQAWMSTKKELLDLKAQVEKDGARLVVVLVPSVMEFDPRTSEFISDEVFDIIKGERSVDIMYPNKRINEILTENNFDYIDLYPLMKEYLDENNIGYPYFSFDCNSHWSTLGHEVSADKIYNILKQEYISI